MRKFLAKHLSYAAVNEDLITLYASEFTEETSPNCSSSLKRS
jgi:hypothetical protein